MKGSSNSIHNNTSNNCCIISPIHSINRKRHKTGNYYSKKYIDGLKLILLYPSPNLIYKEEDTIVTYFGEYSKYQSIEIISKRILNRLLSH